MLLGGQGGQGFGCLDRLHGEGDSRVPVSGQGFRWRRGLVTPGGSFIRAQFEEGVCVEGRGFRSV